MQQQRLTNLIENLKIINETEANSEYLKEFIDKTEKNLQIFEKLQKSYLKNQKLQKRSKNVIHSEFFWLSI